jgi:hypothetical protein
MRLLLRIKSGDSHERVMAFVYESKEKAIADLRAAYHKAEDARVEFCIMYTGECQRLNALRKEMCKYDLFGEPQSLKDELLAQRQKTDLCKSNRPSDDVIFAGLGLTLNSFVVKHEGHHNFSMPEIMTVDEFFAEVETQ